MKSRGQHAGTLTIHKIACLPAYLPTYLPNYLPTLRSRCMTVDCRSPLTSS